VLFKIMRRSFASDNNVGVHSKIMEALQQCNRGHVVGYGEDPFTQTAVARFKALFGKQTGAYFVYGGIGANVTGLQALLQLALCRSVAGKVEWLIG